MVSSYLRITSGAIYSGVPNTCLSENCRVSLSTCTSYKLVATVIMKSHQLIPIYLWRETFYILT